MQDTSAHSPDRFVGKTEAAVFCGVAPRTLDKWAYQKKGPRFRYVSRLRRYSVNDLAAYMASRPSGGGADVPAQSEAA